MSTGYIKKLKDTNGNNVYPVTTIDAVYAPDGSKPLEETYNELSGKIDQCFQSVSSGKELIANAITDKGIETDSTDTFATMAENINNIETGIDTSDATATADQMLSGATAYVDGKKVIGNIVTRNPDAYDQINSLSQGFYNDSADGNDYLWVQFKYNNERLLYDTNLNAVRVEGGALANAINLTADKIKTGEVISGITGTFTSDATATADHILSGYTAYVNGAKVTGSIPVRWGNAETGSPLAVDFHAHGTYYAEVTGANTFMRPPEGYYDGNTWLAVVEPNLKAENVRAGVSIGGGVAVHGTFTSDATAREGVILSGYTAYVNGNKITGNMTTQDAYTLALSGAFGNDKLHLRIPHGGYINSGGAGYPEIMMHQSDLANVIGLNASKLVSGESVLGIAGTGGVKYASGTSYTIKTVTDTYGSGYKLYSSTYRGGSPYDQGNCNIITISTGINWAKVCRVTFVYSDYADNRTTYVFTATEGNTFGSCSDNTTYGASKSTHGYFEGSTGYGVLLSNSTMSIQVPFYIFTNYLKSVVWEVWG